MYLQYNYYSKYIRIWFKIVKQQMTNNIYNMLNIVLMVMMLLSAITFFEMMMLSLCLDLLLILQQKIMPPPASSSLLTIVSISLLKVKLFKFKIW